MRKTPLVERFWPKVNKDGPIPVHCPELGPCWVWTGYKNRDGYGLTSILNTKNIGTHRAAVYLETGQWPTLQVLHHCDNPACVRFTHLFQGTQADNVS